MSESEGTALAEDTEVAAESALDLEVVESGCRVDLDAFSGPLDLLLYLVRKAEVDIADIPIFAIAEQFVATIESWEHADLEQAGDFILMAATLLEIKARIIAPPRETLEGDEEGEPIDPRASLIEQLMAFREVKEQVQILEALETGRARLHHRGWLERIPEDPEAAAGIDLENADAFHLFTAWDRISKIIAGHGPRTVLYNDISIEERRREIIATMRDLQETDLATLLAAVPDTIHRVGIVIAVLDCIRSRHLRARQVEQYGAVRLQFVEDIERNRPLEMLPGDPPLPQEMGPRGRRGRSRPVLQTWDGQTEVTEGEDATEDETCLIESDEDRFVQDLNAATDIDAILKRNAQLDDLVREHLIQEGLLDPDEDPVPLVANLVDSEAGSSTSPGSGSTLSLDADSGVDEDDGDDRTDGDVDLDDDDEDDGEQDDDGYDHDDDDE